MDEKICNSWESLLNPDVLRSNLIMAALYIAAFEVLKSTIVKRIRDFYVTGFDKSVKKDGGRLVDPSSSSVYAPKDGYRSQPHVDSFA